MAHSSAWSNYLVWQILFSIECHTLLFFPFLHLSLCQLHCPTSVASFLSFSFSASEAEISAQNTEILYSEIMKKISARTSSLDLDMLGVLLAFLYKIEVLGNERETEQ